MQPIFESPVGAERTDNDICIVSAAIGTHYQEALTSTRLHCEYYAPEAWRLMFRELPDGCPPHHEQQYAFKIHALQRAVDAGFRYVVWMDTGFQPIGNCKPLWDKIAEDGFYAPRQGHAMLHEYVSDSCLEVLGMRRDEARDVPLVFSGLVGFEMTTQIGKRAWEMWKNTQLWGAWNGPHLNMPGAKMEPWGWKYSGHVSWIPGVSGHRHDEAALSWVMQQIGMTPKCDGFLTLEGNGGFISRHEKLVPARMVL